MKWKNDVVVFYTNADVAVILVVVDVDDVFACKQQQKKTFARQDNKRGGHKFVDFMTK